MKHPNWLRAFHLVKLLKVALAERSVSDTMVYFYGEESDESEV